MATNFDDEICDHDQYRCLQCANVGCAVRGCPGQGFDQMNCRSCGHIERVLA
jgi:hypothetical protein